MIEYFEAKTYINDVVTEELFKSSGSALAHVESVYEAHMARVRSRAAKDTANEGSRVEEGFRVEEDVLARSDPASLFNRKVVWAEDVPDQPGYVRWHKDYFYVTRKTLTLRED